MKRLACITIAAGNSSRLGEPKQLVQLKGQSLLTHTLQLAKSVTNEVTCVLGFNAGEMSNQVADLLIPYINNLNWQQGMGTSIASGIDSLNEKVDGVLILLCDQWAINQNDLNELVLAWQSNPEKIIACKYYEAKHDQKVLGAPAIFPRAYFDELRELKETGARSLLNKHRENLLSFVLEQAALDLDTPQDLEHFKQVNGL